MDHWRKHFGVIDAILLFETLGNELSLVTLNVSICITFPAKYITRGNYVGPGWCLNEIPGMQVLDLGEFGLY